MAKIHILEKHVAELIAAGEVVERPASVVKELLENAIDAGATQITLSIESGGVRLIELVDNGTGIEMEYISTAFIRHATSKIQDENDLNSIATLGFRGEALASIASVARVEVLTKTQEDEFATSYRMEGGEEISREVSARAVGTTIRVRDLFYNTPARMKFLKKDASEGTFVADLVAHVALSHPEISFKFVREGKLQYVTPGDANLQSAAYAVLGREFARDLIAVADESGQYRVSGYVSPPKGCRASRSMQYFYINGRYVKNRTMMAALETAYKGTLMHGKFPGCVLSLAMPVDLIDVNVHPAKTEVRFAREKDVFEAVYRAVKGALAQSDKDMRFVTLGGEVSATEPSVQPDGLSKVQPAQQPIVSPSGQMVHGGQSGVSTVAAVAQKQTIQSAPATSKPYQVVRGDAPIAAVTRFHSPVVDDTTTQGANPFVQVKVETPKKTLSFTPVKSQELVLDINPQVEHCAVEEEPLYKTVTKTPLSEQSIVETSVSSVFETVEETPLSEGASEELAQVQQLDLLPAEQTALEPAQEKEQLRYVGEVFHTYIIAQHGDAICLIDKHAAHERMIYEQLRAGYGNVASQMLLEAVVVNLSASEKQALLENVDMLENAGLEIDDFGGTSVLVRAVPADIVVNDVENLTVELAAKLVHGGTDALSSNTEWILHSISCRAAIKAGDKNHDMQLVYLANRILSGEIPKYCPHGRPCLITLTRKELEKQFGRIE